MARLSYAFILGLIVILIWNHFCLWSFPTLLTAPAELLRIAWFGFFSAVRIALKNPNHAIRGSSPGVASGLIHPRAVSSSCVQHHFLLRSRLDAGWHRGWMRRCWIAGIVAPYYASFVRRRRIAAGGGVGSGRVRRSISLPVAVARQFVLCESRPMLWLIALPCRWLAACSYAWWARSVARCRCRRTFTRTCWLPHISDRWLAEHKISLRCLPSCTVT